MYLYTFIGRIIIWESRQAGIQTDSFWIIKLAFFEHFVMKLSLYAYVT